MAIQGNPILRDRSITSLSGSSQQLVPAEQDRQFIMIENPNAANAIWVNLSGGAAAANTGGSIQIPAGKAWWSTTFVPQGAITVIGAATDDVTCYTAP